VAADQRFVAEPLRPRRGAALMASRRAHQPAEARPLPLVQPIVPVLRAEPFDDPAYLFEPK
jgi:hypothetical protein